MLRLASTTEHAWARGVAVGLDELLLDHAHCEKKAASTAVNLIFRYQDQPELMAPLSALAREELAHFELVLELLERRGIPFGPLSPSPYAGELYREVRSEEPARLLDTLLVCALIEARSCERMQHLAESLPDPELAGMYRGLLASEARHHATYVGLARARFPDAEARLAELAVHEARVLARMPAEFRMHSR
jgi:tRNA 2-(methylsulfanyl)-N6-isopentenyladenosine37 hydroxylase